MYHPAALFHCSCSQVRAHDGKQGRYRSDALSPPPGQATLRHNKAEDPRLDAAAVQAKLGAEELTVGARALFLGRTHFGCLATVLPDVSRGLSKQVLFAVLCVARPVVWSCLSGVLAGWPHAPSGSVKVPWCCCAPHHKFSMSLHNLPVSCPISSGQ